MSVLAGELAAIARRHPGRPALRRGGEALGAGPLAEAAAWRAETLAGGRGPVPLDHSDPVRFVVEFFAARMAGRNAAVRPPGTPDELVRMREEAEGRGRWPEGGATAFYTSGSVGASRAVPLTDSNLAAGALAFAERGEIRPGDVVAIGVPAAHVFGFVRGVLNALLVGAEAVFFVPRRDALAEAASLGAAVALLPAGALGPAARRRSRVSLRAVFCGGGRVREEDVEAIENVRGVPVRTGYGLTESAGLGARQRVDRARRAGSSGPPAPGLELGVFAEDGSALPRGEAGEIRLRGAAVFEGYLSPDDPPPFDDAGRLRTGDVGVLDGDGELHVRGRLAYSLASRGRVLCAEEVEAALEEHPGVVHAAAAPVGRAFAVLVVARDPSPAALDDIRRHADRRLPAYARPRRLVGVAELPRTAAGKIDRGEAARRLASDGPESAS